MATRTASVILQAKSTCDTDGYPSSTVASSGWDSVLVNPGDTVQISVRSGNSNLGGGPGEVNYGYLASGTPGATGGTFIQGETFSLEFNPIFIDVTNISSSGTISIWCEPFQLDSTVGWRGRVVVTVEPLPDAPTVDMTFSDYGTGIAIQASTGITSYGTLNYRFSTNDRGGYTTGWQTSNSLGVGYVWQGTTWTVEVRATNALGQTDITSDTDVVPYLQVSTNLTLTVTPNDYSRELDNYRIGYFTDFTTAGSTQPSVTGVTDSPSTIYWISTAFSGGSDMVARRDAANSDIVGRTYTTAVSPYSRTFYDPLTDGVAMTDMPPIGTARGYFIWASDLSGQNGVFTGLSYLISRVDASITLNPSTTSLSSSSIADVYVNVTGDSTGTQYRLYTDDIPRWVSTYTPGQADPNDFTISYSEAELPPTSGTYTYFSQARIPESSAGSGAWLDTGDSFNISRSAADNTPDDFELGGPVTSAALTTNYFSNIITVAGMDTGQTQTVTVSGTGSPAYSKNGGAYTSSSGSVTNGDTLVLRVTSSSSSSTTVTGTLTLVSGVSEDSFSVTTAAAAGTGDLDPPTAANYGLEIRGPDGTSKVLTATKRFASIKDIVPINLTPAQTKTYTVEEANGVSTYGVVILYSDTELIQITKFASSFQAKNLSPTEGLIAKAAVVLVE